MAADLPSVVRLGTTQKAASALGLAGELFRSVSLAPGAFSVRIGCSEPTLLSGKKAEATDESTMILKPNQHALIGLPDMPFSPKRYHFLISVNPDLYLSAQVSHPAVVSYLELDKLRLLVSTFKTLDLSQLSYVFELTAID